MDSWNKTVEGLWAAFTKTDIENAEIQTRIQDLEIEVAILEAELQLAKIENQTWRKTMEKVLDTTLTIPGLKEEK